METDCLPAGAVQRAQLLIGAVHDGSPAEVAALLASLDRHGLHTLTVTLAAMVPTDYTPSELLAWNDVRYLRPVAVPTNEPALPTVRELKPHGTHAAHNRHKKNGEEPCEPCKFGESDYQARRHTDRRARELAEQQLREMAS